MGNGMIHGVSLYNLKTIEVLGGDVLHAMKKSDAGFNGFGEAYFSTIHYGRVKAWKKHVAMTLNLVVPVGEIKFVIHDDRQGSDTAGSFSEIILSRSNYKRLTIPPGLWFGFSGVGASENLVINIADIEHDPTESISIPSDSIPYDWHRTSVSRP